MTEVTGVGPEQKSNGFTHAQKDVPASRAPFIREAARALTSARLARLSVDAQPSDDGNFTVALSDTTTEKGSEDRYNQYLQSGNINIALLTARAAERAHSSSGQTQDEQSVRRVTDQVVASLATHKNIYRALREYLSGGGRRPGELRGEIEKIEKVNPKTSGPLLPKGSKVRNPTVPLTKHPVVSEALRDCLKYPDVPSGVVEFIAVSDDEQLHQDMVDNFSRHLSQVAESPYPSGGLDGMIGLHFSPLIGTASQGLVRGRYPLAERDLASMYNTLKGTQFKHDTSLNTQNILGGLAETAEKTVQQIEKYPL